MFHKTLLPSNYFISIKFSSGLWGGVNKIPVSKILRKEGE